MTAKLTSRQKKLLNFLQTQIPLCRKPFAETANALNSSEKQILHQIKLLKQKGIILKIGPIVNYRALGRKTTLAAAHIGKQKLPEVVKAVNALDTISHNYLRDHYYNLWFTIRGSSFQQVNGVLKELSRKLDVELKSLPALRQFKLDVRFDARSSGTKLLKSRQPAASEKKVRLNKIEMQVLSKLHKDLQIRAQPFDFLTTDKLNILKVIQTLQALCKKGVIRRIAAVVDYKRIGFTANALFACKVQQRRINKVGKALAKLPIVSHCYSRKPFTGFDYNLFAMCHAKTIDRINRIVRDFTKKEKIKDYVLLPTLKELKKNSSRIL